MVYTGTVYLSDSISAKSQRLYYVASTTLVYGLVHAGMKAPVLNKKVIEVLVANGVGGLTAPLQSTKEVHYCTILEKVCPLFCIITCLSCVKKMNIRSEIDVLKSVQYWSQFINLWTFNT